MPAVKQPKGWGRMWGAFALAFACIIVQAFAFALGMLSGSDNATLTVGELVGGAVALLFVVALGGKAMAVPSMKGMRETWRILRWIFLVDAVIALVDIVSVIADGSFEVASLWPLRIILLFLMCAGIGLFEEATFRGLVLGGLMARMGVSYRGLFWAVVVSSIIFGIVHIDITTLNTSDPSQVAQAILKIGQTGVFGFAAAAAVVVTGNIWPCVLIHGLNDFILMFVFNGLSAEPVTTEYVTSGTEGLLTIGVYLLLIVAYIPSLVVAYRAIKAHPVPDRGPFYRFRTVQAASPYTSVPAYQANATYPAGTAHAATAHQAGTAYPEVAAYQAGAAYQADPTHRTGATSAGTAYPANPAYVTDYPYPAIAAHPTAAGEAYPTETPTKPV